MESLQGKVAIVTGASSGIGSAIALYFAKQGVRLSLGGRKQNNLETVAKSTGLPTEDLLTTVGDLVKEEDRQNLIAKTIEKFGRLDILVNNAGILELSFLADITEEHYNNIIDINLKAHIFLTKLAIPYLIETKEIGPKGVRVNSISPGLILTNIFERSNLATFTGSELSFDNLEKATPLQRSGTAEEIAKVAAFLASDMASFVTGELLFADGGIRLGVF